MASGTWTWTRLTYDKVQTDKTALVHIDACKDNHIDEIFFTQWNDDGSPCNYETSFLGVFDMSSYALTIEKNINQTVFEYIMNSDYKDALLVSKLNESPTSPLPLLWDDPLLGIHLNNETAKNLDIIDQTVAFFDNYIKEFEDRQIHDAFEIEHTYIIAKLLKLKCIIRRELLDRYLNEKSLLPVAELCTEAIQETEKLLVSYRTMWLNRYKAFGLDVIQSRLATLSYRYKETIDRINDYQEKKINQIDELDEKLGPHQILRMNHMNIAYSSIHVLSY